MLRTFVILMNLFQEKLAPELSLNPKRSSPALEAYGFETYVPSYNNPGNGTPSFSSLSWGDTELEIGLGFAATVMAGFKVCLPFCRTCNTYLVFHCHGRVQGMSAVLSDLQHLLSLSLLAAD